MLWNNTLFGYKFKGKTYVLTTTTSLHFSRRRRKHEDENKLASMRSLSLIENLTSGRPRSRNRRACLRPLLVTLSNENGDGDGDRRLSGKIQIIICARLAGKSLTFCVRPRRETNHFDVG